MDELELSAEREALTIGEQLLLRTVRLLALEAGCENLSLRFEGACGCLGGEAYRALSAFVEQLRLQGRRRIRVSAPGAPGLTADEAAILAVFACAQADDYRSLDERLAGLLSGEPPGWLAAAACLVGQAFGFSGLVLRAPEPPGGHAPRPASRPLSPPASASCGSWGSAPSCAGGWTWA